MRHRSIFPESGHVLTLRHRRTADACFAVSRPSRLAEKLADRQAAILFDADDVAQDTFIRVMGGEPLTTIRDPKSFLCTIAKRVMIDLFRRNALERAWLEMIAQLPEALAPSAELQQIQLETLQQVDAMLDGLSQKAREAFCSRSWKA